jgi:3'(2'), 5'-bisphosphate nucleotidase
MFSQELDACEALALRAGELALAIYCQPFDVAFKEGDDPVTAADRALNAMLVEAIATRFPQDVVIGEESTWDGAVESGRVWFIDPIDGTRDFVKKNGEWSIMIGLVVDGRPSVGVVYQAATGDLYSAASGAGAWHRVGSSRRQLRVSDDQDAEELVHVSSRSHPDARIQTLVRALGIQREYQHGSVGCKLAQIAEQRASLYVNLSGACHMWDCAGPDVLIREAGGILMDLRGRPLSYTGRDTLVRAPFVATTGRLAPLVLEHIARLPGWMELMEHP